MKVLRFFLLSVLASTSAIAQQAVPAAPGGVSADVPPAPRPDLQNRISIDVLVKDKAGKQVAGLEPTEFTLLDNEESRKILSFRRTDGTLGNRVDLPEEVIIVLDAVNLPYQAITLQRLELEKFLRQNGGHLAQPTSLFIHSSLGLHAQPKPSTDGMALATMLHQATGTVRAMDASAGLEGLVEQFHRSVGTLSDIAEYEAKKPGHKLLIWLGPGWPIIADSRAKESNESRADYFRRVVRLSKQLREARISVYGIYNVVGVTSHGLWEAYAKPLREVKKAETGHLALQVLANQTGGRVIDPSTDLVAQINDCLRDVGAYYTLTFPAPAAERPNEYHELKVQVATPGLTTRTTTGYYDQP